MYYLRVRVARAGAGAALGVLGGCGAAPAGRPRRDALGAGGAGCSLKRRRFFKTLVKFPFS